MVYEWDTRRAKRASLIRMIAALLAGLVIAGIPAWIVAKAIEL